MQPLKLGVLGVSRHYGLRVHKSISDSYLIDPISLGSRTLERAQKAAERWGFKKAYGTYQEVIDDPDVEAVYISLPNSIHAEWIKRCVDVGKAVLCEKPIAMNAVEAADALEYAEKKSVLAMEAFMYRFHPQWIKAREVLNAGEIGEIMSIHTIFSFFNNDPRNIRNQRDLGGGVLYDIGCYAISSARFLLNQDPDRVFADIKYDAVTNVDTLCSAIMDFGGSKASFTVSTRMAPRQKVSVFGSKGSLEIIRPFNAHPDVPLLLVINDGSSQREVPCGPADQYRMMLEDFTQSLRNGDTASIPGSDSIVNMKIIDAVFRSGGSGGWENIQSPV